MYAGLGPEMDGLYRISHEPKGNLLRARDHYALDVDQSGASSASADMPDRHS